MRLRRVHFVFSNFLRAKSLAPDRREVFLKRDYGFFAILCSDTEPTSVRIQSDNCCALTCWSRLVFCSSCQLRIAKMRSTNGRNSRTFAQLRDMRNRNAQRFEWFLGMLRWSEGVTGQMASTRSNQ